MTAGRILFEPWGLGDALIAAATLRESPADYAIACHPRWIPILRSALNETPGAEFLPVELPYTTRSRVSRVDTGVRHGAAPVNDVKEVLSIRGDLRDLRAARRLFPRAHLRVTGWFGFIARRSSVADLPFRMGLRSVRNRYKAWAELAGIPFDKIARQYEVRRPTGSSSRQVVLHVGAQWRSRQYPHAAALRTLLENKGCEVTILAGMGDALPTGISETDVHRVLDRDLVAAFRQADIGVTNDSGPMHLSAFLGCRTLAIARVSNIDEWVPPGVTVIAGDRMPHGYRPDRSYTTDAIVTGWPEPKVVAGELLRIGY